MQQIAYIGSYGQEGLHITRMDPHTGALQLVDAVPQLHAPSYLALTQNRKYLYAAGRSETSSAQKGEVAAYAIGENGGLTLLNRLSAASAEGPCHLSSSLDGKQVYAAHYDTGRGVVYHCEEDGRLFGPIQVLQNSGTGPHPQQDVAHLHYAGPTPEDGYVCFVDLALDSIQIYRREADDSLRLYSTAHVPLGHGARHLVFHPKGHMAYVVGEMQSTVSAYGYSQGKLYYQGCVSTLPAGYGGRQSASAIRMNQQGTRLYVGNRFADNFAIFSLDNYDMPDLQHNIPCLWPRDINLSPCGQFLYVCGQLQDAVQVFRLDAETGAARDTGLTYALPMPTCIEFL